MLQLSLAAPSCVYVLLGAGADQAPVVFDTVQTLREAGMMRG